MALRTFNPVTPSQRGLVLIDRSQLWKGQPEKSLVAGKNKLAGRSNGRIAVRHRGGGHKQKYRLIDFKRQKIDMVATVERIEYDPNRTAFIALLRYEDGELSYIIAPQRLSMGDTVTAGAHADIKVGNALQLKNIPIGTIVHNVEMKPGKGGQLGRSAGSYVQIVGRGGDNAQLKLSSGELRVVPSQCMATIGAVSNADNKNVKLGKAGRSRWMGRRPSVRGVAMNPVDHPHGGGEGKTSGGRHPVSPQGFPTKGKKTRRNKATSRFIIRRRNSR